MWKCGMGEIGAGKEGCRTKMSSYFKILVDCASHHPFLTWTSHSTPRSFSWKSHPPWGPQQTPSSQGAGSAAASSVSLLLPCTSPTAALSSL